MIIIIRNSYKLESEDKVKVLVMRLGGAVTQSKTENGCEGKGKAMTFNREERFGILKVILMKKKREACERIEISECCDEHICGKGDNSVVKAASLGRDCFEFFKSMKGDWNVRER